MQKVYIRKRTSGNRVVMSGPKLRTEALVFEPYRYNCGEEITLPKVDDYILDVEFLKVFAGRRSIKRLGGCSLEALSRILFLAVKPYMIGMDEYGVAVYRSAAPSAGGRHPIDVLVGLNKGGEYLLYLYQPLNHSLRTLLIPAELQRAFIEDVKSTLFFSESALLWFSVQNIRTASKYTDYESLVWRDIGAQLCCIQQASKYVGLDSCPIGYLAEETFSTLFQTNSLMSGGGMIVGKRLV